MPGFKLIVKGDSKLAVLRGLSYQLYSWSLANLEEIPTISTYLSLSFRHGVRESNIVADSLARAGASSTDLAFDMQSSSCSFK